MFGRTEKFLSHSRLAVVNAVGAALTPSIAVMRAMNNGSGGMAFMTKTGVAMSMIALRNFWASTPTSEKRQKNRSGRA
jgi:2-methylcitrate dehydratase PrpD